MNAGVALLIRLLVAQIRVALVLCGLLVGCASPHAPIIQASPGERPASRPPSASDSSRHIQLALLSDGPTTGGESTGQPLQGYNVPGRRPGSQMPWEFFLGNAAHRLIGYMYGVNHPLNRVFYNQESIFGILSKMDIGDPSRLPSHESTLRPDITDVTAASLFEIKPWNEQGLQEGRQEVEIYLAALNRAAAPEMSFVAGTSFQGQILIRFAQGEYIWRLEWQTTEPGVTQYRWTRSQQRFASEKAAYDAGQWVDLTTEEMQQYGGWVGQAVEGMVKRREQLASFSGVVGIIIDGVGTAAEGVFSGAIFGRGSARPGAQPPVQGGGQVIPFPSRPGSTVPPAKVPAAMGR
jgi:hypothetical protein